MDVFQRKKKEFIWRKDEYETLQRIFYQKKWRYGGAGRFESSELYTAACLNKHGVSLHR